MPMPMPKTTAIGSVITPRNVTASNTHAAATAITPRARAARAVRTSTASRAASAASTNDAMPMAIPWSVVPPGSDANNTAASAAMA